MTLSNACLSINQIVSRTFPFVRWDMARPETGRVFSVHGVDADRSSLWLDLHLANKYSPEHYDLYDVCSGGVLVPEAADKRLMGLLRVIQQNLTL